jgi:hypothetical protein
MFKKILKGVALGAAVVTIAGAAHAAEREINLYGASAQYLFWNDAADSFLTTAPYNCTAGNITQGEDSSKRHGVTRAINCGDGNNWSFRYSSKASFDGILSLKGDWTYATSSERCAIGEATCAGGTVPAGQEQFYRKMASSPATPNTLCCARVNIGASDVAGDAFVQSTYGFIKGNASGGGTTANPYITREFTGINTSGLSFGNPVTVPFGFFLNNTITKTRCIEPEPKSPTIADKAVSRWGNQCYDPNQTGQSANCIGYYKCVDHDNNAGTQTQCNGGVNINQPCDQITDCPDVLLAATRCERIPLDNISRSMANLIFASKVSFWQALGAWFDGDGNLGTTQDTIHACYRHAGSGTHATFDLGVMDGYGWGNATPQFQKNLGNPRRWFNDGSSDMMACINRQAGAIGYADCDQLVGTKGSGTPANFTYPNVHAAKYNGVECTRPKVRNGEYEFWAKGFLYYNPTVFPAADFTNLVNFAKNPNNIPASKAEYWATDGEMKVKRQADSDFNYIDNQTAETPQVP